MFIVPYLLLFLFIFSIVITLSGINGTKKMKQRLHETFGKIPERQDYEFQTDMKSVASYYFHKNKHKEQTLSIDSITWDDLDMDKIYERINCCQSSIGEEYLYAVLHEPAFDLEKLTKRENFIAFLDTHPDDRLSLQLLFGKFGKVNYNDLASFIFDNSPAPLKHPILYRILASIPLLSIVLMFFYLKSGLVLFLSSMLINTLLHYLYKRRISFQVTAVSYLSGMLWCADKICALKSEGLAPYLESLKKSFYIFKKITSKITVSTNKGFSDLDVLVEYLRIIFLMDLRNYNKMLTVVATHRETFHQLFEDMGEIEIAICILSFRKSLPHHCAPTFHSNKTVSFENLFHPLLKDPVSNTAILAEDCLITGSNASGKSTFIKAIAINGILAQTIYTCTANAFHTRFNLVMSSMAVRDNILEGESYFISEIKSLKRILDKVKEIPCLCFVDEILKGTNTIERIAASASVLSYLHQEDCLCIVASHDIELTEMLKNYYSNYHFRETVTDDGIFFDYKLKEGPSQTRNAIKLLHFMEFDEEIVSGAENHVDYFSENRRWL